MCVCVLLFINNTTNKVHVRKYYPKHFQDLCNLGVSKANGAEIILADCDLLKSK